MTTRTAAPTAPTFAQRAWGITGLILLLVGLIPAVLVVVLASVVDENYGWFMIIVLPLFLAAGMGCLLCGVVGLVFAIVRRQAFVWPVVAIAAGTLSAGALAIFTGLL